MGNDLATIEPATDCSTLVSTASAKAVLDRAFDVTTTFSPGEMALAERIAGLVVTPLPADDDYVRRSIGSLAGALPSQATSNEGGKLKLKTYQTMLAGCDERALAYACRRCLDELDWMPTVHQIKERMALWVSPEQAAIARARVIVRTGRRAPEGEVADPADLQAIVALRMRLEGSAGLLVCPRPKPVAFDHAGPLAPNEVRIPNKGDYERLFGIDPEAVRAKAEAAQRAEEEFDRDLLVGAYKVHAQLYGQSASGASEDVACQLQEAN